MSEMTLFNRNFLRDFFEDSHGPGFFVRPLHGDALKPDFKVDIKELKDAYQIQAELPGVKKEDIHVTVDSGILTISAEMKQHDSEEKEGQIIRSERYYGSVSRSLQLPQEIDSERTEAKYENGILNLHLGKLTSTKSNRIPIK